MGTGWWKWAAAAVVLAVGCSNGSRECRAPAYRDEAGRCVIACTDAPGAVCDPDSGMVLGYVDASAETGGGSDGGGCDGGLVCDGGCVAADDPNHCGGCGVVCSAPTGATATCSQGSCGWSCNAGYERAGAGCEVAAPRLVGPLSASTVTSQRPTLRWALPAGGEGATVEVCPVRDFADARCQTIDAVGSSGRVATALTPGVWFWRAHGRVGGTVGTRTSAVWEFRVGARSAGDTSWGTFLDVNGDGLADVAVSAPAADGGAGRVYVYTGRTGGLGHVPLVILAPAGATRIHATTAGDVNGDGYGDLLIGAPTPSTTWGRVFLYLGSAAGVGTVPALEFTSGLADTELSTGASGVGDVDGDGYADVLIPHVRAEAAHVYPGGLNGPAPIPAVSLRSGTPGDGFGTAVSPIGDIDGDGRSEFVVSALTQTSQYFRLYAGAAQLDALPVVRDIPAQDAGDIGYGVAIRPAGDVDGDGTPDATIAVVRPAPDGHIYVFHGVPGSKDLTRIGALADPAGSPGASGFGWVASGGGDVDANGFDDLLVTSVYQDRVFVYFGSATGLQDGSRQELMDPVDPAAFAVGMGGKLAGDIDGDQRCDVVVSAVAGDSTRSGSIAVYLNTAAGLPISPTDSFFNTAMDDGYGLLLARVGRWRADSLSVHRSAGAASEASGCRNRQRHS